jgi:phage terminase small subunit
LQKLIKRGGTVKNLNTRQKKFAEYYAQSGNASESARRAGYSAKYINSNVQKLLQNTAISEYIKQLSDKLKDERIMSAKDRQVALSDIARNGGQDTSDRIRAIDTLNKMTGEYTVKVEAKVEQSEKLSDVFRQLGGEGLSE